MSTIQDHHPAGPAPKMNPLAIISIISSVVIALAGVITGAIALQQIKSTGERGRGIAIAGIIIGSFGIMIWIVIIAVGIAGFFVFDANHVSY